jgi:hypothetical protein
MPYPSSPDLNYSYTGFQQAQGDNSFPGTQMDADLQSVESSVDSIVSFLQGAFRSDGVVKAASMPTLPDFVAEAEDIAEVAAAAAVADKADKVITISAAGLATGGGSLAANRIITVPKADQTVAEGATNDTDAMTALAVARQGRVLQIGPSSADLAAAWAAGHRRLRGTKGFEYQISTLMSLTVNEDVYLDFAGCGWKQVGSAGLLSLIPPYEEEQAVSASTRITKVVENAALFSPGDTIKIISVGVKAPIWTAVNSIKGEYVTITGVNAGTNTLTHSRSIFDYDEAEDVDVQVARISSAKVELNIGWLTSSDETGTAGNLVHLEGCRDVDVEIGDIKETWATALKLIGLHGGQVHVGSIQFAEDAAADGFEYGISASSCQEVLFSGACCRVLRHTFTTGAAITGGFADSGISARNRFVGFSSDGSTTAAFDSHHGAYGNTYHQLRAHGGEVAHGFSLRGVGHKLIGCEAEGCSRSIQVFVEDIYEGTGGAATDDIIIEGFYSRNPKTNWLSVGVDVGRTYLMGGQFIIDDGVNRIVLVECTAGEYTFIGGGAVFRSNVPVTTAMFRLRTAGTWLEIDGILIDLYDSDWSADALHGIINVESGRFLRAQNIRLRNDAATGLKFFYSGAAPGAGSKFGNIEIDYLADDFFQNTALAWWQIALANMITGPIKVHAGATLDIEPRKRDFTRYIDGNVGLRLWTAGTSIAATATPQELPDDVFVARQSGGSNVTFARSTDVPTITGGSVAPYSLMATSVADTTLMYAEKYLTVSQSLALAEQGVTVCWVKGVSGRTITIDIRKADVADVFTASTSLETLAFTATGAWQEISFSRAMLAADIANGLVIRIQVNANAASQVMRWAAFGTARGLVPPIFDLAPHAYDVAAVA